MCVFPDNMLINEDLPTLDLPINANSGNSDLGTWDSAVKLPMNFIFNCVDKLFSLVGIFIEGQKY